MEKIRHNHPDLKGSFTCLGNWYNVLDREEMLEVGAMIMLCNKTDRKTATKEIEEAKEATLNWKPKSYLMFLYKAYRDQNAGNPDKLKKVDFLED